MTGWVPLTEKQMRYLRGTAESWLNVAEGGKRAGKNILNTLAFSLNLLNHPDRLHLCAGVSLAAARLNILDSNGFGLKALFQGRCRTGRYNGRDALYVMTGKGEKIVLFVGGGKSNDAALIKGNTFGMAYLTEVNECHESFVREVLDRTLSSGCRRVFMDLNPKPPRHWFYVNFLDMWDRAVEEGTMEPFNKAHFTMADNMAFSREKLREVLSTYDRKSPWFRSEILGMRTSASGRIYVSFDEDCLISGEELDRLRFREMSVGVDVGGRDATVAALCGLTEDGCVVVVDGMYHRQGVDDRMDAQAYAGLITEKIRAWSLRYPLPMTVKVDSANKLFRLQLDRELLSGNVRGIPVRAFNKSDGILARIELTLSLMHRGRFRISSHLRAWQEAYETAVWDEKAREDGKWERLDDGSCPVDILDATEYGFYDFRRWVLPG